MPNTLATALAAYILQHYNMSEQDVEALGPQESFDFLLRVAQEMGVLTVA